MIAVAGKDVWQIEHPDWTHGAACRETGASAAMDRAGSLCLLPPVTVKAKRLIAASSIPLLRSQV